MKTDTSNQPHYSVEPQGSARGRILAHPGALGKAGRRRRCVVIGLMAVLAFGVWHASLRQPTGAATGVALEGPVLRAAAERATFRIGTLNLHGCVGRDERYDMDRVANCLRTLDVVGVNEAHGWSCAESANQVAMLGTLLNMGWLYAPAEQRWYCRQFGNGLLSTRPTDRWERIVLPGEFAKSRRNMLLVRVGCENRAVQVLITHLIRSQDGLRRQQFQQAASLFLSLETPVVLAGDLNMDGSDPQIRKLLATAGVVDVLAGKRSSAENTGVDWILVRGLRVVEAGAREEGASDHPLVWAELALPRGNDAGAANDSNRAGMAPSARNRLQ